MVIKDPVDDLLHFSKIKEILLVRFLEGAIKTCGKWCPFTHNKEGKTEVSCYYMNPSVQKVIKFLDRYSQLFKYFEISPSNEKRLREIAKGIEDPLSNLSLKIFKRNLSRAKDFIKDHKKEFFKESRKFTCVEAIRMGEALKCFEIDSYFAAIILAVSAVESRMHTLLKNKNKRIYEKEFQKASIGKIIGFMDPSQYKEKKYEQSKKIIKKIIPDKHMSLIRLLNEYRIFSAHPKEEYVGFNLTNSVLSLSFAFLLDQEVALSEEALKCWK